MERWITQDIIQGINKVGFNTVTVLPDSGGDFDTQELLVSVANDESLWIAGFVLDDAIRAKDDVDVEYVYITDGLESDHGLSSHYPETAEAYIKIRQILIDMKFTVVDSMDAYF